MFQNIMHKCTKFRRIHREFLPLPGSEAIAHEVGKPAGGHLIHLGGRQAQPLSVQSPDRLRGQSPQGIPGSGPDLPPGLLHRLGRLIPGLPAGLRHPIHLQSDPPAAAVPAPVPDPTSVPGAETRRPAGLRRRQAEKLGRSPCHSINARRLLLQLPVQVRREGQPQIHQGFTLRLREDHTACTRLGQEPLLSPQQIQIPGLLPPHGGTPPP